MWNAIDLHMHTSVGVTRKGGKDNVNFNYELFTKVIDDYDLKLIAITNHNIIDFPNYIMSRYLGLRKDCNVLLGVELDTCIVNTENEALHTVAITSSEFENNFRMSRKINNITEEKKQKNEVIFSPDEIIELISNHNLVLIPHSYKSRGIFFNATEENIKNALSLVNDGFVRVFDDTSNWKLAEVKDFIMSKKFSGNIDDFGGVLFSDIRDWSKYDEKFRNFYMNAEPTFKGLVHSLTNPTQRFSKKDHVQYNTNYIKKVVIKKKISGESTAEDGLKITEDTIYLDRGYNCVIGKSGSGKSLFVEMLKTKLFNKVNSSYDVLSKYEVLLYNENNKLIDWNNTSAGIGANIYDKIIEVNKSSDNQDMFDIISVINNDFKGKEKFDSYNKQFEKYVQDFITILENIDSNKELSKELIIAFNNNEMKLRELANIVIFELDLPIKIKLSYSKETIDLFKEYPKEISQLKKYANLLIGDDKTALIKQIDNLEKEFKDKEDKIDKIYFNENFKINKYNIIQDTITHVNGVSSKNAMSKSNIESNIVNAIDEISKAIIKYKLNQLNEFNTKINYDISQVNNKEYINAKKTIHVEETVDEINIKNISERENKLFKTYGKMTQLSYKIYDITKSVELKNLLKVYFKKNIITKDFSLSDEFDIEVNVFFDNQNIKKLNPGDIAKTYLEVYFEENVIESNNSIIIFDQIENNVDKDFISTVIKTQINNTKGRIQFIVVTHDPIVAVNSDPTNYILSEKSNSLINYRNFKAESSKNDELTTIANTVDGSKNVIKNRYEIYKGDNNGY